MAARFYAHVSRATSADLHVSPSYACMFVSHVFDYVFTYVFLLPLVPLSFVIYSSPCLCICSPLLPCLISPLSRVPLPFILYSDHCLYICSHCYRLVPAPSYCPCSLLLISCLASHIQVPRRAWGPTVSQAQAGTAIALTISSSSS